MTEDHANDAEGLDFESDPGSGRSKWVAGALVLALAAWMGSGFVFPAEPPQEDAAESRQPDAVTVAVRQSSAKEVQQFFRAEGEAEPERDTPIRAETTGAVAELFVRKGTDVTAASAIARIAPAQRQADLQRAQEELRRAQREYDNAETLLERGVATVDRVAQTRSALAAAEAELSAAREALDDTTISAPFDGRLEALNIETGEIVNSGEEVARIVDLTPLTVAVQVPQQSLSSLETGQSAEVTFITGETREGRVSFVGSSADPETRTFAAEIEVPNDDLGIPAGVSAQVRIPIGQTRAHFLSPAILSLNAAGQLGIKTVNDDNVVEFHNAVIARAQTDGVWVTGLPDEAQIITVGQGYVNEGETVTPKQEDELRIDKVRGEATPVARATE